MKYMMSFPERLFAKDEWRLYLRFQDLNEAHEWLYNEATEAEGQELDSFCDHIWDHAETLLPAWASHVDELKAQNRLEEADRFSMLFEFTSPVMAAPEPEPSSIDTKQKRTHLKLTQDFENANE